MKVASIVGIILIAIVGYFVYDFVLGDTEEASAPISAIPLETTVEPTAVPAAEPTDELMAEEEVVEEEVVAEPTAEPTPEPEMPAFDPGNGTGSAVDTQLVFEIVPEQSEVRFILDEELRGDEVTVVGTTNQVAGQLAVNYSDPTSAQVGVIQINARTLATDVDNRNQAIRNFILNTDAYEFITFAPTSINGLPEAIAPNEAVSFQIVGDLTITDITSEVMFDVTATAVSASELNGSAKTTISRETYGLVIPNVPFVANVEDEVELEIDFVALGIGDTTAEIAPVETVAAPEPTAESVVEADAVATEPMVYEIVPEESEVRFELDEDLRGSRITVVGSTNQVAAQLSFALGDLSTAQMGVLQVNARTIATDNEFRNRAIRNVILETDTYEFITFTPTSIEGLPETAGISDEITFQIIGDLTIRDITTSVTFDVIATPTSDTELVGTAITTVLRDDYGLTIPEVPAVANVEDEVDLIIDFVARVAE
jgi:polyisoprenoid-binding protein YceI